MIEHLVREFHRRRELAKVATPADLCVKRFGFQWKGIVLVLTIFGLLYLSGLYVWAVLNPGQAMRYLQAKSIDTPLGEPVAVTTPSGPVMTWTTGKADGDKVVLVHGFGDAGAGWTKVAQVLEPSYHVTILDLPGHGRSPLGDEPLTMTRLVAGLDAVAQTLDGPLILVGNSMGGWVAAEWALANPGRVRRLVLVNNAGFKRELDPEALMPTTRAGVEAKNRIVMAEHAPSLPGVLLDGLIAINTEPHLRPLFDHLTKEAPKLEGRLGKLQAPVDLIWGTPDAFFPYDSYFKRVLKELGPKQPSNILTGCGHAPQYGCPSMVARAISQWSPEDGIR